MFSWQPYLQALLISLLLAVLLRDEFPVAVRPFTEEVAIDEVFTVQSLAAMLEGRGSWL